MGCNESKNSVAAGNTIAPSRKPAAAGTAPVDELKKVEESAVVPPEEKGPEGGADVKEGTQDIAVAAEEKKDDAAVAVEEKKGDAAKEDEKEKPEKIDEKEEPEQENGDKEIAENVEGSTTKETELALAAPTPMTAETVDPAVPKQVNPPEKVVM